MERQSSFRSIAARLVAPPSGPAADLPVRRPLYRPLICGAAILRRPDGAKRWLVPVSRDGRLRPLAPDSRAGVIARLRAVRGAGLGCRVAAAVMVPQDVPTAMLRRSGRPRPTVEFYGWAILYQPPSMRGVAWVDPHEEFADLPAFYESPLELIDRAEFLAARGVITRPLAVVTQREDFLDANRGHRNRFFPAAEFNRSGGLDWLP